MTSRTFTVSKRIVGYLLIYNFFVWLFFAVLYRYIDFAKHFDVPEGFEQTWDTTSYFAYMVQTQMFGTNIVPKTPLSRGLVSAQSTLAWTQTVIFLAPWFATMR